MVLGMQAQRLVGSAPSRVSVGEQFRLTYTIDSHDVSGFRSGTIPEEFEVLMGPSVSQQSSFQMVNGRTSSTESITYTYILSATKNGSFTIPAARISVDGRTVTSNTLKIQVSGNAQAQTGGRQQPQGSHALRPAGSAISGSDLFIKVSANKSRVHEQEPVLLTYKVYTLVELTSLNGEMPDLKGFHTQEIPLPQQKSFHMETINGRPYRTVTWRQYVMFPQLTGRLEIPSITFEGVVVQENRDIDPFEALFNGGSNYVEVKKKITAPGLALQVDPLPTRPTGFSGGVGRYTVEASVDKTQLKANTPVTLRVKVKGIGNMKLLKEPVVKFPQDFDRYDAKVTDNTKLTTNGVEGEMIYDFLAVPRHQGTFTIPAVEFVYYDTGENAYKTLHTESFTLQVDKGDAAGNVADFTSSATDASDRDIYPIKGGSSWQRSVRPSFFGSTAYWVALGILALTFILLFVIFRQRAIDNANIGKMRGKKANKVATKRLKQAARLMKADKADQFYDEVLRALWGYVGDKLNIPVEQLSRENISQLLAGRSVDEDTIRLFMSALDECEFERYAPGDAKGNMNMTFDAAMGAITQIENTMKKGHKKSEKSGGRSVNAYGVLLLIAVACSALLFPLSATAVTKESADSAYARQQYQQAISDYEALLKEGVSAELYYNLGNAYYRSDNITRAVINYERALLLVPADRDVRHNLQIARNKTADKMVQPSEMFFVTWYRSLMMLLGVDGWASLALIAMALAVLLVLVYLFSSRVSFQKAGFFGAAAMLLLFVMANLFAYQQQRLLTHRTGAVITVPAVTLKTTPSKGSADVATLHEGTHVDILDDTMQGWRQVRMADGKDGWIELKSIEVI